MKDKKLQVFVSSTYTDLIEERQAAVEAILLSGNIPAGMELFSAGDESQMTVIERWIDESDVYLLILGGRYGSVDKKTGKSYTQLEYEYALRKGKPLFAVVITETALDLKVQKLGRHAIEQENSKLLLEFRSIVLGNLVKFWDKKEEIMLAIFQTLFEFSNRADLAGWVRGGNNINMGFLAEEMARLTKENSDLRKEINAIDIKSNIFYAGLSFTELQSLLKKEVFENGMNLFDFLVENGSQLSTYIERLPELRSRMEKLEKFNLIHNLGFVHGSGRYYSYKFTEDGHKFYLRTLVSLNQNAEDEAIS